MSKYNTDYFSQNVLLDLFHLQHQLCISRPFGTWFLYSKKSPLFTFLWSILEQDRRFELPPSVWKTDVLTVNTNLAYKDGEPSSPRAIFNVVFWRDGFTTNSPLVFTAAFTQVTREREGLLDFHIYNMTKKTSDLPLNAKNTLHFHKKVESALHGKKIGERRRRSPYKNKSFLISMLLYALLFKKSTDLLKIPQFFGWNHK